ncbi:carboxymuconolactone decarboxylase family protein [Natrinema gelatinilyticum]|uniref:carboxymuconolactone decarboxylase family protein n=1 Tax=Natrinema gelatinilyticum TaxID=2961571 RepID=UPI0020C2CB04|nr:carboxymuconolactone decarboxylase family protein [Natrinema gelatinilyticum]
MVRVPLVNQSDLPEEYQYLMDEDALGERNIFRAMGNNPDILKSYMLYGTTVWNECGLSAHDRELVILAIGRALRSEYEWEQHVDIGYNEDVSPEAMRAIGRDDLSYFDKESQTLLEYSQAFARNEMTDEIHRRLEEYFDDETVTGVGMLSSHYVATGFMLESFDVPLELDDFVGWEPSDEDIERLQEAA